MDVAVFADAEAAALAAAENLAAGILDAVAARGRFACAFSGGSTPWRMLRALAQETLPWQHVHVFQVDERCVPAGDPERNLTHLRESLAEAPLPTSGLHGMPVEAEDLAAAAADYARALARAAGTPPVLDLVHLGLGVDGHTASLVPGDAVLGVADADVATTAQPYRGHRRMTLTFPTLARARRILWLVTGVDKAPALARLRAGDASIPAGRVARARAVLFCDRAALGES